MKRLLTLLVLGCGLAVAGCSGGDISAADQHSKQKQIDEATAKLNPEGEPPKEAGSQGN